jgi:hypothetical protein
MFNPEPIIRDQDGFWLHSVLRAAEEQCIDDLPESEGMEFHYVDFENDAPQELKEIWEQATRFLFDGDDEILFADAIAPWEPTPPEGEGWFLIGIYDTEDGPYACFTRAKEADA